MKYIGIVLLVTIVSSKSFSQCACTAGAASGSSFSNISNGMFTLEKKKFLIEGYVDYRTINEHSEHQHDVTHTTEETPLKSMFISSLGVRYGLTEKFTLSAILPHVFLHTKQGNDRGVGDLILLGTFSILNKSKINIAIQGGAELPTGIQKKANFDNATMVIGSGSFDPMIGMLFSKSWDNLSLQGNGLFKITTNGFENNNYGSVALQNLTLTYPVKGNNNICSTDSSDCNKAAEVGWSVNGGYYGEWLGKIVENNMTDNNSGYYLGFATIGTNFSYNKWTIPLTFSIPFIQQLNGGQNNAGYRLRLGILRMF